MTWQPKRQTIPLAKHASSKSPPVPDAGARTIPSEIVQARLTSVGHLFDPSRRFCIVACGATPEGLLLQESRTGSGSIPWVSASQIVAGGS
ncbi:MAG TPA: hypothetical protein VIX82_17820 [Solirubrobacteraceae bacterium]